MLKQHEALDILLRERQFYHIKLVSLSNFWFTDSFFLCFVFFLLMLARQTNHKLSSKYSSERVTEPEVLSMVSHVLNSSVKYKYLTSNNNSTKTVQMKGKPNRKCWTCNTVQTLISSKLCLVVGSCYSSEKKVNVWENYLRQPASSGWDHLINQTPRAVVLTQLFQCHKVTLLDLWSVKLTTSWKTECCLWKSSVVKS